MANETQNQQSREIGELKLISEIGGYQLYTTDNFDSFERNPKNVEIIKSNDKLKIIVDEKRLKGQGLEEIREDKIRRANGFVHNGEDFLTLDEGIRNMEDFRERHGPLCAFLESDKIKLKGVPHTHGHDKNYLNVYSRYADSLLYFLDIGGGESDVYLASMPEDLMKKREEELNLSYESRSIGCIISNIGREEFYKNAKNGKINQSDLEYIAGKANENIPGERLITPEIVRETVYLSLDTLSQEISRVKSAAAIVRYMESRREK